MADYTVSARSYLSRAEEQLSVGTSASLFYAAFEIRCAVEARLREYLEPHSHIAEVKRAAWRIGNLHRTTELAFGLGDQVTRIRIHRRRGRELIATLYYTAVSIRLKRLVERFGNYFHAAKRFYPAEDLFWASFRAELDEAVRLLSEAITGTLLGPMLLREGTKEAILPLELIPGENGVTQTYRDLKGEDLVLEVRYFPISALPRVRANKRRPSWGTAELCSLANVLTQFSCSRDAR
jgi:hypothetical protein